LWLKLAKKGQKKIKKLFGRTLAFFEHLSQTNYISFL